MGSGFEIPKFSIITIYRKLTSDETSHPALVPLRAVVRWSSLFYQQLLWDRAFVRAAAMAYTTLIAFVPLLLLVFGILSGAGVLQQDRDTIERILFGTFGLVGPAGAWPESTFVDSVYCTWGGFDFPAHPLRDSRKKLMCRRGTSEDENTMKQVPRSSCPGKRLRGIC